VESGDRLLEGLGVSAMKTSEMKTAAVIPAFNAEKKVGQVVSGLYRLVDHVIVVDDGSKDRTAEIAAQVGAEVLDHSQNRGLGAALQTGFTRALDKDFDFVVTLDADGQHSTADIKKILVRLENNECDLVIGSRLIDRSQWHKFPLVRLIGNLLLTSLTNLAVGRKVTTDSQSGYRAFRKEVLREIGLRSNRMSISSEIVVETALKGFVIAEVPIEATYEDEVSYQQVVRDPSSIIWLLIKRLVARKITQFIRLFRVLSFEKNF
jgi:glycosyltransferase involved in cell wall biosynthesis